MNCQACGLFIANKVSQCPRCSQVLIELPTGTTGSKTDVSIHANAPHSDQPVRSRSGALRPPTKMLFRRPGMPLETKKTGPQSEPFAAPISPSPSIQVISEPLRTPISEPFKNSPISLSGQGPVLLPSEPLYSQDKTPNHTSLLMAQTASQHSTYETPPPIQKPVFQPLPPAQLSTAGGRGAKFVEPRTSKSQGSARLILFAGLCICVLLVLIAGGYLLLQNLAQPDGQAGQMSKVYPTAVPTLLPLTNTDPQELYQQAIKRKTLLADPLKTQSSYDWEAVNTDGSCMFENQQLHLSSIQGGKAILCLEQALTFDNFVFQARMTLHQGDTGGLLIRANTAGNKLYMFGLTTSGRYLLASVQQQTGSQPHIITGGLSSAITQDTNQLTIIARQHTFYLYINDRYLTKITDPTISSGKVGLFAGDSQQNIPDATFSNARVWGV